MKKNLSSENFDEIQVAERKYLRENYNKKLKIQILVLCFFTIFGLILFRNNKNVLILSFFNKDVNKQDDVRVLGHFPYQEISEKNLVEIEPNILVHKDMYLSLIEMKKDAEKDGIYLVFLSGYRSIKLQKEIFYSLKSLRNQNAMERARVSAPPGYSEHSTGFAIDIGDAFSRETDFEVSFEKTNAFKWLKNNAAKYHFRLSFDKEQNSVDYEPWHWRYEGSIEALQIFESSNRNFVDIN